MKEPKVSILIPFKKLNEQVEDCIRNCLKLNYTNYDIILLPDKPINKKYHKTKVIPTGPVHQSAKRNIAIFKTDSDIIASIDSDAYPDKNWLKNAVLLFKDNKIGAVGGPNLAPKNSPHLEKAAIDIVYSKLGLASGYNLRKYKLRGAFEHKEVASSNLLARVGLLREIGGYYKNLPTGEDSILSFKIRKLNKKIIYSPKVVVYHHRRKLFLPHLRRIFEQARDKAVILKASFSKDKSVYFVPSIFVICLITGAILSFFNSTVSIIYFSVLAFYAFLVIAESINSKGFYASLLVFLGLPLTHLSYGVGFLFGLILQKKKQIKELKKIFQ
ncbi:glycosyltransferase [Nanoarchaeota archaeon]